MIFRSLLLPFTVLLAVGCPGPRSPAAPGPSARENTDGALTWKLSKSGLGFRLSNADDEADDPRERQAAPSTPLGASDAKKLASRLPEIARDPDDQKDFAMRAKSIPAPRPGKTVNEPFPPPAGPPPASVAPPGPLAIERRAPEGDVPIAPHLTLTFSHPMVPVTSQGSLKEHPPVRLVPEPPGAWRWLGTRTLLFQPEGRFPMATEYSVEVPAGEGSSPVGARALNGQTLARAEAWSFTTPPPTLKTRYPVSGSQRRDPLVFVAFDQAVDPKAMLGSIALTSAAGSVPIRLAEPDEVEANERVRRLAQQEERGRWLAFRAIDRLPSATTFTVRIKAGAPSAEGPKRTQREQSFTFSTHGPMRVSSHRCGYSRYPGAKEDCPPLAPFEIAFSNTIDLETFDKDRMVKVSPEIPGMKVEAYGATMVVRGRTKGRTKYTVTVDGAIGDVHGQTMGSSTSVAFDVGSAEPTMFGADAPMVVLDPASKAKEYRVYTINEPSLRARVYAVTPKDWDRYRDYHQEWERPRKIQPPGRLVYDSVVTPKKVPDELVSTAIDLAPALSGGLGQALVVVEPTRPPPVGGRRPELHVWVQSTEMGLDAMVESDRVTSWATRLSDGAPLEGVAVQLLGAGEAKTDAQGVARVPLGPTSGRLVVGRKGRDVVIIPERWFGEGQYALRPRGDAVRWLMYDDRGTYKPGEEVRIKGWVRRAELDRGGDLDALPDVAARHVSYKVRDPRGAELAAGTASVDAYGGFDLAFKLPGNANLGSAHVEVVLSGDLAGASSYHRFAIEEFRRPEFEVTARASEGPHVVGTHAIATLNASYYSGGGLPDAPATWTIARSTVGFTPPNRGEYHFGPEPRMFWSLHAPGDEASPSETWTAKTNARGVHRLRLDFDAVSPAYPMRLALTGHVEDKNRQQWAGRTSMLVHPSNAYAGLKLAKNFVRAGESIETDAIVVDVDGNALPARHVVVKAARIEAEQKGVAWEEKEHEVQTCEADSPRVSRSPNPTEERIRCAFKTREGGRWRVTAIVTDEHGRKNQTTTSLWVMGDSLPKDRGLERGAVNVVLDKDGYQPGQVAEVLVVAPFTPAEGLLTVRRQGIVHVERFSMKAASRTIQVKLDEALVPNAEIHVDLVGQDVRREGGDAKRPAFASGSAEARVLPTRRTLDVKATARAPALEPGGATQIDLEVKDHAGRGVSGAEVALVVADEAVLALSGYATPDPIGVFYARRGSDVHDLGMRDSVLLGEVDLDKLDAMNAGAPATGIGFGRAKMQRPMEGFDGAPPPQPAAAPMPATAPAKRSDKREAAGAVAREESVVGDADTPVRVRRDFAPLALFAPAVKTDAQGKVTVPVKLPETLTRYRVMAVAATKDRHFGANESTITARLPVMVRPSAPRFLNFGDRFDLPVILQNQTDRPIDVGVVARATNATLEEPSAKRVTIAANDRALVQFSAATVKPGTARFQIGVASGAFSDATEIAVPVWTPATTEAFATYGEIDQGAMGQPVKMPPNVFSQFGGLEITTSSTQLQALTDAVVYLVNYPFDCNEQLASRVLSLAALRDVLTAFASKELPPPAALEAQVKTDFEKLKRRQHASGGWGFWQESPWPLLSIHVAHALVRAKDKGYAPDEAMLRRAQSYLRSIEAHVPSWYPEDVKRAIVAYALYVRGRMKDADPAKARQLVASAGGVDKLGMEAVGWIWPTISADPGSAKENEAIRRHVANRVTETAGAAHFVTGYKDASYVMLHSDRRADGILLEAMIGDQRESSLIPKLVKGLLAHRKAGRWQSTQENAFVLLALDRYFATYEKVTPDFVARVWLGERYAGDHAFKGRTTEFSHIGIPMQFLASEKAKEQSLVIGKDGPGRLYYRIGMQYAPTDLKLPPADSGFVVSRVYEGADDAGDVKRDADGTWRVKAGAKVRVRVSMVAPSRRYHVALVDPIPAGLEPMNAALAVTGEIPKDPKGTSADRSWFWTRTWYEHQNMRDERVEAFASLLWDGVWDYSYVARATTTGTFVVAPAKAEEMYSPETFGRSSGDRVIVE